MLKNIYEKELMKHMNPLKKQPPRGVLEKRCSEYVQQVYRRKPMPECDFRTLQNAFL